jgi:hypothetical protein
VPLKIDRSEFYHEKNGVVNIVKPNLTAVLQDRSKFIPDLGSDYT